MGKYGGESNAKKLARAKMWMSVAPPGIHRANNALVLCGPVAGDVRAAIGARVPASNVVAVDMDEDCLKLSAAIVPDATYIHDDVFHYLKTCKKKFDVVFLDFCSTLSDKLIRNVCAVMKRNVRSGGRLVLGAMYGRESKGNVGDELFVRNVLDRSNRKGLNPEDCAKARELGWEWTEPSSAALGRIRYVWGKHIAYGRQFKILPDAVCHITYRSGRRKGGKSIGVPMLYSGFRVTHTGRDQGRLVWNRRVKASLVGKINLEGVPDDPDGEHLRRAVMQLWKKLKEEIPQHTSEVNFVLANTFNISVRQLAAWKAWDTRRAEQEA